MFRGKIFITFFLVLFFGNSFSQNSSSIKSVSERLKKEFNYSSVKNFLLVDENAQLLYVVKNDSIIKKYFVSTAKAGAGNKAGSNKTPLGVHRVAKKIGAGVTSGTIFIGR